jgi:hypothetical protein
MNEYWIVKDRRTGKIIAHCGNINDAIMLVALDSHYRSYSRHRVLVDQVIDVSFTTDKQLSGQIGLPHGPALVLDKVREKLPEGQQEPVIV